MLRHIVRYNSVSKSQSVWSSLIPPFSLFHSSYYTYLLTKELHFADCTVTSVKSNLHTYVCLLPVSMQRNFFVSDINILSIYLCMPIIILRTFSPRAIYDIQIKSYIAMLVCYNCRIIKSIPLSFSLSL